MSGPESPESKRMKFSDIMDDATAALPPTSVSPCIVSNAITAQFLRAVSKKNRKEKAYSIDKSTQSLLAALKRNARVAELEQKSTFALDKEMQTLLHPNMASYHGPDSVQLLPGGSHDGIQGKCT